MNDVGTITRQQLNPGQGLLGSKVQVSREKQKKMSARGKWFTVGVVLLNQMYMYVNKISCFVVSRNAVN